MKFSDKLKWILGISMVFVLIISTNLIDRNNFERVNNASVNIYEDRLISKNLLFDINNAMHEKHIALISNDSAFFQTKRNVVNEQIDAFIERYDKIATGSTETLVFERLKESHNKLKASEVENFNKASIDRLASDITQIQTQLMALSKIQMEEGGKQVAISERAMDTVELFTQLEIYMLIILAIVIQIIVISKPKED